MMQTVFPTARISDHRFELPLTSHFYFRWRTTLPGLKRVGDLLVVSHACILPGWRKGRSIVVGAGTAVMSNEAVGVTVASVTRRPIRCRTMIALKEMMRTQEGSLE